MGGRWPRLSWVSAAETSVIVLGGVELLEADSRVVVTAPLLMLLLLLLQPEGTARWRRRGR